MKTKEMLILVVGAIVLVSAYFFLDTSDTLFGTIEDKITPVDWNEVHPRNIVKNSIPIELLEKNNGSCLVKANTFEMIINHPYFVKNQEITQKLQYNQEEKTITIPCNQLPEEKSRLHVWYVVEESDQHATKWAYTITFWNETTPGFLKPQNVTSP